MRKIPSQLFKKCPGYNNLYFLIRGASPLERYQKFCEIAQNYFLPYTATFDDPDSCELCGQLSFAPISNTDPHYIRSQVCIQKFSSGVINLNLELHKP